jgi:hypothetical protein
LFPRRNGMSTQLFSHVGGSALRARGTLQAARQRRSMRAKAHMSSLKKFRKENGLTVGGECIFLP